MLGSQGTRERTRQALRLCGRLRSGLGIQCHQRAHPHTGTPTGTNPSEDSLGTLPSRAGKKALSSQALAWCPQLPKVTLFPPASAYFSGSNQLNQPGLPAHPASGRSTLLAFSGRGSSLREFSPWGLEEEASGGPGRAVAGPPKCVALPRRRNSCLPPACFST